MNKLFLCFAACSSINFSLAQSVSPQVISTSGTSYNNGTSQLDWTLGERVTSTYNAGSDIMTQGFHQPNLIITSLNDPETDYSVNIFPNPSTELINLKFKNLKDILTVELFSADGKLLLSKQTDMAAELQFNMLEYSPGIYLLSIKNKESEIKSYRIVKSN